MTTDDAIEHAARYLPEGWELIIAVEAGYASLEAFDDQGERRLAFDFERRTVPTSERLCDMVDGARRMAGELSVPRPE